MIGLQHITLAIWLSILMILFATVASADRAPKGYEHLNSPHKHAFRYTQAGEPVRRGRLAERFELRNGDCIPPECRANRLRSEIREPKQRTLARTGQDIWYGWSFHVSQSPNMPGRDGLYPFFGQWKTAPDNSPTVMFIQSDHGNQDVVFVSLSDMARQNNNSVGGAKHGNICKNVFSISSAKKSWIDIVMTTNFATDRSGYLKVWVNEKLVCDYSGQIVATKSGQDYPGPNHRRGIYVGNTLKWQTVHGSQPVPTWVVYYDEFLVGASRIDVDTRLREKAGLPAKD